MKKKTKDIWDQVFHVPHILSLCWARSVLTVLSLSAVQFCDKSSDNIWPKD